MALQSAEHVLEGVWQPHFALPRTMPLVFIEIIGESERCEKLRKNGLRCRLSAAWLEALVCSGAVVLISLISLDGSYPRQGVNE